MKECSVCANIRVKVGLTQYVVRAYTAVGVVHASGRLRYFNQTSPYRTLEARAYQVRHNNNVGSRTPKAQLRYAAAGKMYDTTPNVIKLNAINRVGAGSCRPFKYRQTMPGLRGCGGLATGSTLPMSLAVTMAETHGLL